jgi:hypothetical protein
VVPKRAGADELVGGEVVEGYLNVGELEGKVRGGCVGCTFSRGYAGGRGTITGARYGAERQARDSGHQSIDCVYSPKTFKLPIKEKLAGTRENWIVELSTAIGC